MEREDEASHVNNGPSESDAMDIESPQEPKGNFQRDMSVDMITSPPPTEALPAPPANMSMVEERRKEFIQAQLKPLAEGEDQYLLSGKWYKKFMKQESDGEPSKEDIDVDGPMDGEGVIGPIDNRDFAGSKERLSDDQEGYYEILEGAQLDEDYVAIPKVTWDNLVSTFGIQAGSPVMKRPVVNTGEIGSENLQIDLNPPIFTVYTIKSSQPLSHSALKSDAEDSKPKRILVSKGEIFQGFLVRIKRLLNIDLTQKIRVWKISQDVELADKITVDLNTFLNISENDGDRERIDQNDNSAQFVAGKYKSNTFNIHLTGLADRPRCKIIIEAQEDGQWPSETVGKALKKNTGQGAIPVGVTKGGVSTASISSLKSSGLARQNNSNAGSSSATSSGSSYNTRSQTRKDGKSVGTCGLNNLGNTCYMNSALQCLKSVEELSEYFLNQDHLRELNPQNPLSHNGKVATAYGILLKNLFSPTTPSSFAPREFKSVIGKFAPSFSGFGQQDSQEFLAFVLDGLHEDLNRIHEKPYIEKPESSDEMVGDKEAIGALAKKCWDIYKARNDSAVADLFGGQYKSTLVCPECEKVSITFDPFMDLTLPLPLENFWSKEVTFVPRKNGATPYSKCIDVRVEMDKHGSIKAMKDFVAQRVGVDSSRIVSSEVYRNRFYKHHDEHSTVGESIQQNDTIFLYEVDETPTNHPPPRSPKRSTRSMLSIGYNSYDDDDTSADSFDKSASERLLVPVFHRYTKETRKYQNPEVFGLPFFIVIKREEAHDYDSILAKIVEGYQTFTSANLFDESWFNSSSLQSEEPSEVEVGSSEDETDLADRKVNIEEDKDGSEGFVDISMKDAVSDSEDASTSPAAGGNTKPPATKEGKKTKAPSRRLLAAWDEMLKVKVFRNRGSSGILPTAWQGIDNNLPLLKSRVRRPPTPAGNRRRKGKAPPGKSHLAGPLSTPSESDEDEDIQNGTFEDAENGDSSNVELMNDASDDDESSDELIASKPANRKAATSTIGSGAFYRNGTSNNTNRAFNRNNGLLSNRSREASPSLEDNALLKIGEGIVCDWSAEGYDKVFMGKGDDDDDRGVGQFDASETYKDEELERKRALRENRKRNGIHLEDCLDEFAKPEILSADDPWYCPRCKEHRRASKTFELWKSPDILVIHLKRFSSSRSFRDKIDALIDFPIEGLDLTNRVGEKEEGRELIYDLFAVDNHYGGLGGGHYTAHAKNWKDNTWYTFDDSSVRSVSARSVVSPAAYLLFYRRRSDKYLGGAKYEELLGKRGDNLSGKGSPSSSQSSSGSPRASSTSQSSGDGAHGGVGGASSSANQPTSVFNNSRLQGTQASAPINIASARADDVLPSYSEINNDELYDLKDDDENKPAPTIAPFSSSTLFGPPTKDAVASGVSGGFGVLKNTGPHFSFSSQTSDNLYDDDDEGLEADDDADTEGIKKAAEKSEEDNGAVTISQFPKPMQTESSEVDNLVN